MTGNYRKFKRLIKNILPCIMAAAIFIGISAVTFTAMGLMPDYSGGVSMSDLTVKYSNTESDDIYPWNLFSDSDFTMDEFLTENEIDPTEGEYFYDSADRALLESNMSMYENNYFSARILQNICGNLTEIIYHYMSFFEDIDIKNLSDPLPDAPDITQTIMVHDEGDGGMYFYIQNFPVNSASGEKYSANLAWHWNQLIFEDFVPESRGSALSESDFNTYSREALEYVTAIREYPYPSDFESLYKNNSMILDSMISNTYLTDEDYRRTGFEMSLEMIGNPVYSVFSSITFNFGIFGISYLWPVYDLLAWGEISMFDPDGTVCLLFESTDSSNSMALYYDGGLGAFTGFSLCFEN